MRGDLDAIGELLDPDVKWHGGDPCGRLPEPQADARVDAPSERRRAAPPGEVVEHDRRRRQGRRDHAAAPARTSEPELVANLTTFRDGKVIEMVHYPNPDDALAAAGV